jgi:serine/threonine-protein kinase
VPDLSGKHVVSALELLSDLSLNTKVKEMEYSPDIPMHHVISQDPLPGFEIKPGRDVRIILSKGPESVVVPSLSGLPFNQARIVLDENGIAIGNVARVYHENASIDTILSQVPSPGNTIHRHRKVDLLVSLGERPSDFMMPDLSGLSIDEAIQRMEKVGLVLGVARSVTRSGQPANKIVGQSPSPGYRVSARDAVNLTINRQGDVPGRLISQAGDLLLLRHTTSPGFLNRHVRVRLNCYGLTTDIFEDFVKPGVASWFFIPMEPNAAAFLYEDDVLIKSEVIE